MKFGPAPSQSAVIGRPAEALPPSSTPPISPAASQLLLQSTPDSSPPPIADHELHRVIGRGAYGEVWIGRHTRLGTWRAVKIIRRDNFGDPRPFQREFDGIRRYEPISRGHPNLVNILHVGGTDECFYYVMELADGAVNPKSEVRSSKEIRNPNAEATVPSDAIRTSGVGLLSGFDLRNSDLYTPHTLRSELKQHGPLPIDRCLEIAHALASALAHLHANGLVHRDVKPSNVIFVGGVAKLADIGLVAGVDDARSFVGTEGYIPPEGPGTPSADCYSLGKLLYEVSTGHDRTAWPEPPVDLATRPDRERLLELNAILHRACAPDPRERYPRAEEMRVELELLRSGKSVKRKHTVQRRWEAGKKVGLVFVLFVSIASGIFVLMRSLPDRDLRSANQEANTWVEQGNLAVLSATPDRQRRALDCFKRAVELDPKFVPAHFGLFRVYMGQREENRSADFNSNLRRTAARLMELAPKRAEAWIASAYTKWEHHRWRDALADAQKATQMHAGSKEGRGSAHDLYGCYLVCSGYPKAALQQFQLAEREFGEDPTIQQHLGFPYFVRGDFDEALKHFQSATDSEPRYEGGHCWAGRVYEEKGEFEKAIDEFEEYDRLTGLHKGRPYYDDLRQAVREGAGEGYWTRHLRTAMSAPHPYAYEIASLLARLGRQEEAYKHLEEADKKGEIDPGNLAFDLCWDRHDERFKAIARKNGLALH